MIDTKEVIIYTPNGILFNCEKEKFLSFATIFLDLALMVANSDGERQKHWVYQIFKYNLSQKWYIKKKVA